FSKVNLAESYKGVNVKGDGFFTNKSGSRVKQALNDAWAFLYPMLPYLIIGVFIGAFIYGFIPESFITQYASGDSIISVIIASVIGIPMYIRPETMLPIAEALVRSEEHTSELQSRFDLVCRLLRTPICMFTLFLHDALPILSNVTLFNYWCIYRCIYLWIYSRKLYNTICEWR